MIDFEERKFVQKKGGHRSNVVKTNSQFAGIVHEVNKRSTFYDLMDMLKLEEFVNDEGLFNEYIDAERNWMGRSELVKDARPAEFPDLFESEEGHIPVCSLLSTIHHGLFIQIESCT